ncbi:hypothetical protein L1987_83695 [Smallanthus sonchifolius]|uniref:Uncharacterized protein n=1 Tax=Smallanthus sonchifolius TaxID=185202 RepID=A0ACB8YGW2_9ASTR|nr:hypothetical protein L1987_83695 [Smallanthus sonchifolius]
MTCKTCYLTKGEQMMDLTSHQEEEKYKHDLATLALIQCPGSILVFRCLLPSSKTLEVRSDSVVWLSMGEEQPIIVTETLVSKLDASDPLYLHASDSCNLTIANVKLKGTENYTVWANAIKLALEVKNKVGFIDGTCIKSTEDNILAKQWDRCNSVVITWILNSVSDELYLGQVYSKLASEV